jgi:hypothetical protein
MPVDPLIEWLLAGDPAIRWQTLCHLGRPFQSERRRVAAEGWGAQLLALQDDAGKWGGGLYTPKWTSTTYTLLLLRDMGLPRGNRQALRACRLLLDGGFWRNGGINFYPQRATHSETCITSMVLAAAACFGLEDERLDALAKHLRGAQMRDGGWNCRAPHGRATHSSFHTTILALEALRQWGDAETCAPAEEFLLAHRLFRSHRTGEIVKQEFTRFHFPPRWHYDALRALDYFRAAGHSRDPRFQDAIELLQSRRRPDGKWPLARGYPGKVFFDLEPAGRPSRWNTLRALRVLKWWGASS